MKPSTISVALIGVLLVGCQRRDQGTAEAQQTPHEQHTAAQTPQHPHQVNPSATTEERQPPRDLTAPQISSVLELVNTAEIEQARLARDRARHPAVRQFAEEMIRDHTQARERNRTLSRERNISAPQQGEFAARLARDSANLMSSLRGERAESFDRAYVDAQIRQHRDVVALLDANATHVTDRTYRGFLDQVRSTVSHHQAMAEQIQPTLQQRASR